MSTFEIYAALFFATSLYAVLLAWLKHLWEPDFTWMEVIIGCAICLVAPALDQRHNGPLTSELYEWRVWQAFIVGGLPIVIWRVSASVRAWLRIAQRIGKNHDGDTTDRATSVAAKRGTKSEADD